MNKAELKIFKHLVQHSEHMWFSYRRCRTIFLCNSLITFLCSVYVIKTQNICCAVCVDVKSILFCMPSFFSFEEKYNSKMYTFDFHSSSVMYDIHSNGNCIIIMLKSSTSIVHGYNITRCPILNLLLLCLDRTFWCYKRTQTELILHFCRRCR